MLRHELKGAGYSKAEVREHYLAGGLGGRSKASYEKRMGNISHVMVGLGHATIPGYKPLENVGSRVRQRLVQIVEDLDVPEI